METVSPDPPYHVDLALATPWGLPVGQRSWALVSPRGRKGHGAGGARQGCWEPGACCGLWMKQGLWNLGGVMGSCGRFSRDSVDHGCLSRDQWKRWLGVGMLGHSGCCAPRGWWGVLRGRAVQVDVVVTQSPEGGSPGLSVFLVPLPPGGPVDWAAVQGTTVDAYHSPIPVSWDGGHRAWHCLYLATLMSVGSVGWSPLLPQEPPRSTGCGVSRISPPDGSLPPSPSGEAVGWSRGVQWLLCEDGGGGLWGQPAPALHSCSCLLASGPVFSTCSLLLPGTCWPGGGRGGEARHTAGPPQGG